MNQKQRVHNHLKQGNTGGRLKRVLVNTLELKNIIYNYIGEYYVEKKRCIA